MSGACATPGDVSGRGAACSVVATSVAVGLGRGASPGGRRGRRLHACLGGLLCHAGEVLGLDGGALTKQGDEGVVACVVRRAGGAGGRGDVEGEGLGGGVGAGLHVDDAHDGDLVGGSDFFVPGLLGGHGLEELLPHPVLALRYADHFVFSV